MKKITHVLTGSTICRGFCHLTLVTLLLLLGSFVSAHAQQVLTIVDSDSIRVGDTINLSIVLEGNYTLRDYPEAEAFPEDVDMLNRQRFQFEARRDSIVYTLQYFGVEDLTIDPLEFAVTTAEQDTVVRSSRVPLYFKSTLASNEEELRPLKPIFDFARSYWPIILGVALLILLGFLLVKYLRERSRQEMFIPESFRETDFINPLDELEEDIVALRSAKQPTNREEFETFYVRLADSIRRYLKRVYDLPALEMTTREIITELQRERASSELIRDVKNVLRDADMVKFAKFNPASDQVTDAIQTGVDFLETARTMDSDRVEYLEFLHKEEQDNLRQQHEEKQEQLKKEFES